MKKILQLHLSKLLLLVALVTGVTSWGQAGNYTKITSLGALTDGYYVIGSEESSTNLIAMNNTNSGYFLPTDVTISGNTIANPDATVIWRIETNAAGGRTIYNEATQRYVSYTGTSNSAQAVTTVSANSRWTFTYASSLFAISNVAVPTRFLRYNVSSPRFAGYTGTSQLLNLSLFKLVANPTITAAPTARTGFTYVQGSGPSAAQTFTVSGTSFTSATGNITVTSPTAYEVSTTNATTGFAASKTIAFTGSALAATTVWVRLKAGLSAATYNQSVAISGGGATNAAVTVNGSVSALPALTATPATLTGFTYAQGVGPSDTQTFQVTGSALTGAPGVITVAGTTAYEVSVTSATSGFANQVTFNYSAATLPARTIYVRLKSGLQQGAYNGQEIIIDGGGDIIAVTVSGNVTAPPTSLSTSISQLNFGAVETGVTSASQQFTITGESLQPDSNVIVNVSGQGYQVSVDNVTFNTFLVIPVTSSTLSQIVYVHFTPASYGTKTGAISVIGNGPNNVIVTQQVNVTGLGILNTPIAYVASDVLDTAFVANWSSITGANGYLLDVSTTSDFTSFVQGYNSLSVTGTAKLVAGLTAGTTYYYRVRATRTEMPEVTSANSNTVTVATRNVLTWNGTEWVPAGYPTINDVVRIEGDYDTATNNAGNPTPGTLNAFSINVVSGAFTVSSNTTVEIQNGLTVAPTASVTVENNSALIQNEPNAVNSGEVEVVRDNSGLYRLDYSLWSSPVEGQNLVDFSPFTKINRFYEYNTATDQYFSQLDGALDPAADDFETGKGYLIRMPDTDDATGYFEGTTDLVFTGNFEGEIHNGDINVTLSDAANGFNAVGNPYPSPIDAKLFLETYAEGAAPIIDGTIYFWRKRNGLEGDAYASYTTAGGTAATGSTAEGTPITTEAPDGTIEVGQGFIVKVLPGQGGSKTLFTNELRKPNANGLFFRDGNVTEKHRMWFNFTNPEGLTFQSLVAYMDGATNGMDAAIDGKRFTNNNDGFYSVIEDDQLAIQGRALPFTAQDEVTMGYKANTAGSYTISLSDKDGLFAQDQTVFVKDNVTGTLHNIKEGAYTFLTEAGNFNNRFTIVYTDAPAMNTNDYAFTANNVVVYKQGSALTINTGKVVMTGVTVYDIQGRAVYTKNGINATEAVITDLQSQQQVLIVQITTPQGKVSKKVVY